MPELLETSVSPVKFEFLQDCATIVISGDTQINTTNTTNTQFLPTDGITAAAI